MDLINKYNNVFVILNKLEQFRNKKVVIGVNTFEALEKLLEVFDLLYPISRHNGFSKLVDDFLHFPNTDKYALIHYNVGSLLYCKRNSNCKTCHIFSDCPGRKLDSIAFINLSEAKILKDLVIRGVIK